MPGFRNAFADGSTHGEAQGAMSLLNSGRALTACLAPFMVPDVFLVSFSCFKLPLLWVSLSAASVGGSTLQLVCSNTFFVHTPILKTKS